MIKRKREEKKRKVVSAQRRLKEHVSGFERTCVTVPEGVQTFQPKKAQAYRFEIIPYEVTDAVTKFRKDLVHAEPGELYYEQTYWCHFNIGPESKSYVCPLMTFGKPCCICEECNKVKASNPDWFDDEDLKKEVNNLKPKERQLFNIFDHAEPEKEVQLWDLSYHNFGKHLDNKLSTADAEDKDNYDQFADPETGLTVRATASEKPRPGGTYLEFADIEFKERKKGVIDLEDMMDKAVDLAACVKEISSKKLKEMFTATGKDEADEDEDVKVKKNGKPKPKPKVEDEEDDEDGDDSELEEVTDSEDEESEEGDADNSDLEDEDGESDSEDQDEDEIEVGSRVFFKVKGKQKIGIVKKLFDSQKSGEPVARIEVKGDEKPHTILVEELEMHPTISKKELEVEDEEDQELSAKKSKSSKTVAGVGKPTKAGRKPVPDNDDDEDDPFGGDEEEDEDLPPPPKKKKVK